MRPSRQLVILVAAGLAVLVSGAVIAVAGTTSGGPAADANALDVLRRPAQAKDTPDATTRSMLDLFARTNGDDPTGARQTADGVWVVPSGENICIVVDVGGPFARTCAPRNLVNQGITTYSEPERGKAMVAGIVGDGVREVRVELADGDVVALPVTDNGFRSAGLASPPAKLSFTGPDGARSTPLPRR
jgi:hypothetical protein